MADVSCIEATAYVLTALATLALAESVQVIAPFPGPLHVQGFVPVRQVVSPVPCTIAYLTPSFAEAARLL